MKSRVLVLVVLAVVLGVCSLTMRHRLLQALLFFPSRLGTFAPTPGVQDVAIDTPDGERLHGWYVRSRTQPAIAHVLHLHGNAGNVADRIDIAQALAAEGLDVLVFDYRGYGRSTGSPTELGTYADARAARSALLAQPGVDPRRVVYYGESLGGAVAVELATHAAPAAMVLQSAFADLGSLARLHYPFIPAFMVPDAYPSLRRLGGVASPVLVLHGAQDEIIPLDHGRALAAAPGGLRELKVVPGAGHNDLVWAMSPGYGRTVAQWIRGVLRSP